MNPKHNNTRQDVLYGELLSSRPVSPDYDSHCVFDISSYLPQSLKGHITQMSLRGRDWRTRSICQRPGYRWGASHSTCDNTRSIICFQKDLFLHENNRPDWSLLIDRCGSPIEEPSGGGRRSCATKGGQGAWLPVRRVKLHWPLPSTHLSIISSMAAVQVNSCSLHL